MTHQLWNDPQTAQILATSLCWRCAQDLVKPARWSAGDSGAGARNMGVTSETYESASGINGGRRQLHADLPLRGAAVYDGEQQPLGRKLSNHR